MRSITNAIKNFNRIDCNKKTQPPPTLFGGGCVYRILLAIIICEDNVNKPKHQIHYL